MIAAGVIAVAGGVRLAMAWADRQGEAYFLTGARLAETLAKESRALERGDLTALETQYAPDFDGTRLGLGARRLADRRDGIEHDLLVPGRGRADRQAALSEWREYLHSFTTLQEIDIHLEDFEDSSPVNPSAIVAFEAIGVAPDHVRPVVDRARLRMRFGLDGGQYRIRGAALVDGERVAADRALFVDVASAAGVDFLNRSYPAALDPALPFAMIRHGPGGIAAADYDNDGWYDLFVPDGVESRLFRNRGDGTFEDVTARAGLSGLDGVSVGLFADYDNDGFKDLFVSRTFRHNQLFHNNGDGTFRDVTARSGLGDDCCTTVASWGDYDNDGYLDLYLGRYLDARARVPTAFYSRNGEPNQLYHNNGNGTFTNVTERAGVGDRGLCLGTVWGDYDDDGYSDLWLANDFGRDTLLHNNRDGTFTDVTATSGALTYGAGMSANIADIDNDGRLDLYVTAIRSSHRWYAARPALLQLASRSWRTGAWRVLLPSVSEIFHLSGAHFVRVFQQMAAGNALLRNRGGGRFENVTTETAANPPGWFWGAVIADFDNDGWQDIYAADGWIKKERGEDLELDFLHHVVTDPAGFQRGVYTSPAYLERRSWHGWERNRYLRNNGDGTFLEIATPAGTDLLLNSRGVAVADFWNRGTLDIAVAASNEPHALLKNEIGSVRHWLAVELTGTRSNRDAVGARVMIRAGALRQVREVALGDGYASQSSLRQYFGLGDADRADELVVRWPRSGTEQRFTNVAANQILQVIEGTDRLAARIVTAPRAK
jgi:ASPIC and UnbV/FG-GAP-like repeat